MTWLRTPSQPAPATVLWPVAGAVAGLHSVLLGIAGGPLETALSRAHGAYPRWLGELTTVLRLVPVLWHLPAAVVVPRSRP